MLNMHGVVSDVVKTCSHGLIFLALISLSCDLTVRHIAQFA